MASAVSAPTEVLMVPEYKDLSAVYGTDSAIQDRFRKIRDTFKEIYGADPEVYARAPGRVNLIGEHIDYEGYGVLPMAIQQDTVVAIRKGGSVLSISNVDTAKYPTIEFDTNPRQDVDVAKHTWANYFLSAYKGLYEQLEAKAMRVPDAVGLQIVVHGTVPTGAGVSSSAAIVCSCMLAVLAVHGMEISKADVAEFACKAEQHVGVTSGGMDQAISVMGMAGTAMNVEFNPVRGTAVHLPEGATFVIANSLTVSNKAETAPYRYNMRVVECRLAACVLALNLGIPRARAVEMKTLREVQPIIEEHFQGDGHLERAVGAKLKLEPYSREEVEELLGVNLEAMFAGSAASLKVLAVAGQVGGFRLLQRALHVYCEAERVGAFRAVCESSEPVAAKLEQLGTLMNASHESCARLYDCSCHELDELVAAAKTAGAIGSRLTGAGWGGCTVSLVRDAQVEAFKAALKRAYYQPLIDAGRVREEQLGESLFASKPSPGAAILRISV